MECNKDYAAKAKEIAERKFNAKDMAGARKFARKAHKLYPDLEGISQMVVTFDVYAAAENRILDEADWYGVLDVPQQADDDTVRKQYRKLALALHPDKNKTIGAEGAFKLISQAWSVLSDRSRRAAYDAKRNSVSIQQKAKPPPGGDGSSIPPRGNGFYNFSEATKCNSKANKSTSRSNTFTTSRSTDKSDGGSFWTQCPSCKIQYEFLRSFLNRNLVCPECKTAFLAIETRPPASRLSKPWNPSQQGQSYHHEVRTKRKLSSGQRTGDFQWVPFSGNAGVSSVSQAAEVVQQTYEKVRRVREESQAAKKREKAMKKKNYVPETMINSSIEKKRKLSDKVGVGNIQVGHSSPIVSHPPRPGVSDPLQASIIGKLNSTSEIELDNILVVKAKKEISNRLNELKSCRVFAEKGKALGKPTAVKIRKVTACANSVVRGAGSNDAACTGNGAGLNSSGSPILLNVAKEMIAKLSVPVPDSDFYDFNKRRTEMAFEENHVWAVYDNDDGMPRYYVKVHSIISRNPFKIHISWLGSNSDSEPIPLYWFGSVLTKACGDFRVGRREILDNLFCFSHQVRWTKGMGGAIRILPRKGDVWALYKYWSADWNELTSSDVIHKYEMVEVLDNYDEERGVIVIPLVKVAGFNAVFHQHLDPMQARRIPKEEFSRFSHQVPSHLLSGQEGLDAPKGCRELDPAALPSELVQVIANAVEDSVGIQSTEDKKF